MKPGQNDSCATAQACYAVYPVPVAAALWCGVPPDEVADELAHAVPVGRGNALARTTLRHPYLKCLEPRVRAIHAAIDAGELPSCREDERRVDGHDHVAYERRHVYGLDLKEWAKKIAPTERPAFLFDDIERETHAGISVDVYNTLKAAHDTKEHKLVKANERIHELEDERGQLENECRTLRGMEDALVDKLKTAPPLPERAETTYLNIIEGLLKLLIPSEVQDLAGTRYESQSDVIKALIEAFPGKQGIAKKTLEDKFSAANKSFDTSVAVFAGPIPKIRQAVTAIAVHFHPSPT